MNKPKDGPTLPKRWTPRFLESADSRHRSIRLLRERIKLVSEEVNAESQLKKDMVSRLCFLGALLESFEVEALEGGDFQLNKWIFAANCWHGLAKTLGLERLEKVEDLQDYIARFDARKKTRATS